MKEQTGQKILKVYREKYSQKIDMKNALKWTKLPIRVTSAIEECKRVEKFDVFRLF